MTLCPSCGRENPDGFRFCGACGAPLEAPMPPRELRKTVTVLFSDVSGSTALGERLDPETTRRVMTRYFDAMRAAIELHGGTWRSSSATPSWPSSASRWCTRTTR
jgi:hypothetical protein